MNEKLGKEKCFDTNELMINIVEEYFKLRQKYCEIYWIVSIVKDNEFLYIYIYIRKNCIWSEMKRGCIKIKRDWWKEDLVF